MKDEIKKLKSYDLLNNARLNKGSAFSPKEREVLELEGLLPSRISTLEEQAGRMSHEIRRKNDDLDRHITLVALQNRNETLFYKVLFDNLEELMPIVYTPTVGKAVEKFSQIFRKVRGLWITPDHKGRIKSILAKECFQGVELIVATDNESILGLGDQGAGGIAIPIGKLSLYVVAAGIHPSKTLPISLDVGTDNEAYLQDPMYLGWKGKRLRGAAYNEILDEFVEAVGEVFPHAILQWEDFKNHTAFDILNRYQKRVPSFNDDIQGTSSVASACLLAACARSKTKLKEHRILILGAGAAGTGIGRLLQSHLGYQGLTEEDIRRQLMLYDSQGVLTPQTTANDSPEKIKFAWTEADFRHYQLDPTRSAELKTVIKAFRPTVIIGTSGQPGLIDEEIVRGMASYTARPIIFPFSNPTSKAEAVPQDIYAWSEGKALVATGSPFAEVTWNDQKFPISQGNNVFIFPGVGLGAIMAQCTEIPEEIFYTAAKSLKVFTEGLPLGESELLPPVSKLRELTREMALKVWKKLDELGLARKKYDVSEAPKLIDAYMWTPHYEDYC